MEKYEEDHKKGFIERLPMMSNDQLLEDYSSLCGGDDYDGCFTRMGEFEFNLLNSELRKRLKECGFLS